MSVIIKNLNTLLDGGTICIDAWIHYNGETLDKESPTISVDYSLDSDTIGEWFIGLKSKGGKLLTDENLKQQIIKEVEFYLNNQNSILIKLKEPKLPPNIEPTPYL